MRPIIPSLWFDGNAEEAVKFYCSVFKGSKILRVSHYTEVGPLPAGTVLAIAFKLGKTEFLAINGGPEFKPTPALSFVIECRDQKEIDYYWKKLTAGGKEVQCGWLTDKYGYSWQIVAAAQMKRIASKDKAAVDRMMRALGTMVKLDEKKLKAAFEGR
jgi:predicted 3-demethylubiquinone-9 3-methyltransferase (glyoxalase superfamily)